MPDADGKTRRWRQGLQGAGVGAGGPGGDVGERAKGGSHGGGRGVWAFAAGASTTAAGFVPSVHGRANAGAAARIAISRVRRLMRALSTAAARLARMVRV
jgi:hypothetical protein